MKRLGYFLAAALLVYFSSCKAPKNAGTYNVKAVPADEYFEFKGQKNAPPKAEGGSYAAGALQYKVVKEAYSYVGTPYLYGGTSRKGIDCSGMTQNCYAKYGVKLPRSARGQSAVGTPVRWRGDLKPGDLVFFSNKKRGRRKITHVGMVTKNEGEAIKFVHATVNKGVTESDLKHPYWSALYVKAKRPETP